MNTETLIDRLAQNLKPVSRHARLRRIATGIIAGGSVTMLLVGLGLGFRPDLGIAMQGSIFWMKWAYTISLGVGAGALTVRLARPEPLKLTRFWPILMPFAVLAFISIGELARTPTQDWLTMWLSKTWKICPWLVLILSAPIFVGLLWSFKRLAPTRLRAAGAAAGFSAGAWAATLYCLHCPEVSALFVLTWYTLGVALAAGVGSLIGPKVMRW